jgi:hypothetical protein
MCNNLIPLSVIALVFGAGAMFFYNQSDAYRTAMKIGSTAKDLVYDISCTPSGEIAQGRENNCVERDGYRIIRAGNSTTVVKLSEPSRPSVILKIDKSIEYVGDFSELRAAAKVLTPR